MFHHSYLFSPAIISFISSCCNFNLDFFCLVSSAASPSVSSRVGILSDAFIRNNLLLKLLGIFSFVLNNYLNLLKKTVFQLLSKFFKSATEFICSSSVASNYKCSSGISL